MIADIAIELDALRLLTYKAAGRAEQGLSFHREAFLVRVQAAEKGMKIGTDGVQLLGGHGFIREHPVELWYRNLRAIALLEGVVVV
jgi:alkylation response protein AidB-like acyl-CoA dehydrogenase